MTDALLVELLWDDLTLGEQSMPRVCHCYQEYCYSTTRAYYNYGRDNVRSRNGPLRIYSYSCSNVAVKKKEAWNSIQRIESTCLCFVFSKQWVYICCWIHVYSGQLFVFHHSICSFDRNYWFRCSNLSTKPHRRQKRKLLFLLEGYCLVWAPLRCPLLHTLGNFCLQRGGFDGSMFKL